MIQLKVYSGPLKEEQYWLDLYETEPIKLTLSIEDIQTADATSVYSKAFKVPGTRKNAEFFKNSFDVDGTLFDVTTKKPAEILVDGAEFKIGHVRLQKVFLNTELDRYDYELVFLGETRDFSSKIGDKGLCQLQMPDLVGADNGTSLTAADVIQSWDAYPQFTSLTAGLHGGNIIYPLIDHGNSYNTAGVAEQTRISLEGSNNFTQNSHQLTIDRMKPMIRAKRIWDQIFTDAGYTYTSNFIDSDLFHQIYVSAFGNSATIGWDSTASSPTSVNVAHAQNNTPDFGPILLPQAINDPGGNMGVGTFSYGASGYNGVQYTYYTVPEPGEYNIAGQIYYIGETENSDYSNTPVFADLLLWNASTNQPIWSSPPGYQQTLQFNITITTGVTPNFNAGDNICLVIGDPSGNFQLDYMYVADAALDIITAPGKFNPVSSLECTYKQIDFIKDILTAFRLVFSPDPNNPKNFIVEPWQQYINSGDLHDWSKKLVENKDVQIEPIFFSQNAEIDFTFQKGGDYGNIYHEQAYQQAYGWLQFNANNDLLKGKREVKLIGVAPTTILPIEGAAAGSTFIFPQLHTHSSEDTGLQHLPIKPKTRLLFYNGLQTAEDDWYLSGAVAPNANPQPVYPLVSPYQEWPIQPQTLNLNWANDIQYWGTVSGYNELGSTLYTDYWSRYINSLYGKYSRRVTAYFVLNNIDLNNFSFDDTIFINGTYYIPEKIIDVEIGAYTEVKVQLLTANDFRPAVIPEQDLFVNIITGLTGPCGLGTGSIEVETNGTPSFSWTLSNGMSGTELMGAPVGLAPYTFTIPNVPPGTYTITIEDSLTRTDTQIIIVPESTATDVTAISSVTPESTCGACDGTIIVTPSGGTGPYTIEWYDGPVNSFTRADLCAGIYSYTVYDSLGCAQQSFFAEVTCESAPGTVWEFYRASTDCQQILISPTAYVNYPAGQAPTTNHFYKLNDINSGLSIKGCWVATNTSTQTPTATEGLEYLTCEACYDITPPQLEIWRAEICNNPFAKPILILLPTSGVAGQVWYSDDTGLCYSLMEFIGGTSYNVTASGSAFEDCLSCSEIEPIGMLSNKEPENPSMGAVCAMDHPFAIYNSETFDPYHVNIGSYMYEDAAHTIPWNGGNGWYSIADTNTPGLAAVTVYIRTNGLVRAIQFCS